MSSDGAPESLHGLDGKGLRFGIVAARFHQEIVDRLLEGSLTTFQQHGVAAEDILSVRVPGAWEIPLAVQAMMSRGDLDGVVALGVVIRGETPHFDFICAECSAQCAEIAVRSGRPVGFGLLTCETRGQADARSGGAAGNKGEEAALACLEMTAALRSISKS
ncbi:MAG: 6,7-dimethyl-8-ribityllumazine synthase [Acidobacteriota bacterium]